MVCEGVWKQLLSKKKQISYDKFKKIMGIKDNTIDTLCYEIRRLKNDIKKMHVFLHSHNVFLKEKKLFDEYQEWKHKQSVPKNMEMGDR